MRRIVVDRRSLSHCDHCGSRAKPVPVTGKNLIALLDQLGIPDGMPFLIEDGGGLESCGSINEAM
jgi:hypothetical protein